MHLLWHQDWPIASARIQSTISPRRLQRTVRSQLDVTRYLWDEKSKPRPSSAWRGDCKRAVESQIAARSTSPVQANEGEIPAGVLVTSATAVAASTSIGGPTTKPVRREWAPE